MTTLREYDNPRKHLFWLKIFGVGLVLILIFLALFTEEKDQILDSTRIEITSSSSSDYNWDQDDLERYRLQYLKPFGNSQYIYCEFYKRPPFKKKNQQPPTRQTLAEAMKEKTFRQGIIIDTERSERRLAINMDYPKSMDHRSGIFMGYGMRMDGRMRPPSSGNFNIFFNDIMSSRVPFVMRPKILNNEPFIFYHHYPLNKRNQESTSLKKVFTPTTREKTIQSKIGLQGQLTEISDIPFPFYSFDNGKRIVAMDENKVLTEYEFVNGILQNNISWPNVRIPHELNPIENKAYLGYNFELEEYVILPRDGSDVIIFDHGDLWDVIPQDVLPENRVGIQVLTHDPSNPMLVGLTTQNFPVYEILSEQISSGDITKIFKRIVTGYPKKPILSLDGNSVIIFQSDTIRDGMMRVEKNLELIVREKGSDGNLKPPVGPIQNISVTKEPIYICIKPVRDQYFYYYHFDKQSFGRMKWDGSQKRQVFPY